MFSAIFSALGGPIVDAILGNVKGIFEAYFNKQITEAQLREKLQEALVSAFAQVEAAHADALAKCYASFMDAMKQSVIMQRTWAAVVISQLFVLFWYQWIVPVIATWHLLGVQRYASAGTTVEWAYLLLAACLGMGPVVLRSGPGAGNLAGTLKSLIK